jgi:hypothetical protein
VLPGAVGDEKSTVGRAQARDEEWELQQSSSDGGGEDDDDDDDDESVEDSDDDDALASDSGVRTRQRQSAAARKRPARRQRRPVRYDADEFDSEEEEEEEELDMGLSDDEHVVNVARRTRIARADAGVQSARRQRERSAVDAQASTDAADAAAEAMMGLETFRYAGAAPSTPVDSPERARKRKRRTGKGVWAVKEGHDEGEEEEEEEAEAYEADEWDVSEEYDAEGVRRRWRVLRHDGEPGPSTRSSRSQQRNDHHTAALVKVPKKARSARGNTDRPRVSDAGSGAVHPRDRKRMELGPVAYEWLRRYDRREFILGYVPQLGDCVVYIPEGHQAFLDQCVPCRGVSSFILCSSRA